MYTDVIYIMNSIQAYGKLFCLIIDLEVVLPFYVASVKYLGFIFTSDSKNDIDMQRQLWIFMLLL